jgi:hypothetical protein
MERPSIFVKTYDLCSKELGSPICSTSSGRRFIFDDGSRGLRLPKQDSSEAKGTEVARPDSQKPCGKAHKDNVGSFEDQRRQRKSSTHLKNSSLFLDLEYLQAW